MRRSLASLLLVLALGWLTPSAFGQYPYSYAPPVYGPMPVQYAPPMYGPMPVQYAPPMYGPMPASYGPPMPYYSPAPMWQAPPRPNVFVYGPLTDPETTPARPAPAKPAPAPAKSAPLPAKPAPTAAKSATVPAKAATASAKAPGVLPKMDNTKNAKPEVTQAQAISPARTAPAPGTIRRVQMEMPDACGPLGCNECPEYGPCDPVYGYMPACNTRPRRGHGHFIGEVGAYFLVPFSSSRLAYTSTNGGNAQGADFPQTVDFGPRVALGYLFHSGWGFRANYWYLRGSGNQSTSNADPGTLLDSAAPPPFQINSPSLTLQQGIGVDQFNFAQRLEINVADAEFLKEIQIMDTTFLFGAGARYTRILQTYTASRTNPGGSNGAQTVNVDREDVDTGSHFEGWGPTVSVDFVHGIGKSNVSVYGNVRGSFIWGVERFNQSYGAQRNTVTAAGVPTFADVVDASFASDHRVVSIAEAELGLQYGCRVGCCYVYSRIGAVYQRWWEVGTPTSPTGSLTFVGGTARIGISY